MKNARKAVKQFVAKRFLVWLREHDIGVSLCHTGMVRGDAVLSIKACENLVDEWVESSEKGLG